MRSARIVFGTLCFNWLLLVPYTYFMARHVWPKISHQELMSFMTRSGFIEYGLVYGFVSGIIWLVLSAAERSSSRNGAEGLLKKA
jgi:hypothetical protein